MAEDLLTNAGDACVIGVDIGGTTVKLGLFSQEGALLKKWEIPTRTQDSGAQILPDVAASIAGTLAAARISPRQVLGIGLCVPGPVDAHCTVNRCVNLGWGVLDLRAQMQALLPDIPHIAAGNDANAAALGEQWKGGGMGYKSAVLFTFGTGVGGGVVLDGKICTGANSGAGEVGHITVEPRETAACGCGKHGCLEQYASASGVVRMARQMLAECDTPSRLRTLPDLTAKELCDLARADDAMAAAIIDRWGDYTARAMSFVACTIDPEVFVIGGGMSRAGALIVSAIQKHYRRYAFHTSVNTPIKIAQLGNDAGIYGCARLILSAHS